MLPDAITQQVTNITDENKLTLDLIDRLAASSSSNTTSLTSENDNDPSELTADIHESLKQQEDELELLRQQLEHITSRSSTGRQRKESERDRDSSRLTAVLAALADDIQQARVRFRRAQLTARQTAVSRARQERQELLDALRAKPDPTPTANDGKTSPVVAPSTRRNKPRTARDTEQDVLVQSSSDVTAALRRTHALLHGELSRSRFAQETLEQSTQALASLGDRYGSLDSLLASSRTLVGTLLRSQKSDTWYLETAFYILCATIIWLVYRRFLYGPLWWLVYLPLRLLWIPVRGILVTVGLWSTASSAGNATNTVTTSATPLIPVASAATFPSSAPKKPTPPAGGGWGENNRPYLRAGAGGNGAKHRGPHEFSEKVGRMVDEAQQSSEEQSRSQSQPPTQTQQQHHGGTPTQQPTQDASTASESTTVRGDGQPLQPRGDVPKNPKKKTFDPAVQDVPRDEL